MVGTSGLEPPTPTMSRWCSNQLSYAPAENAGVYTPRAANSNVRRSLAYFAHIIPDTRKFS